MQGRKRTAKNYKFEFVMVYFTILKKCAMAYILSPKVWLAF